MAPCELSNYISLLNGKRCHLDPSLEACFVNLDMPAPRPRPINFAKWSAFFLSQSQQSTHFLLPPKSLLQRCHPSKRTIYNLISPDIPLTKMSYLYSIILIIIAVMSFVESFVPSATTHHQSLHILHSTTAPPFFFATTEVDTDAPVPANPASASGPLDHDVSIYFFMLYASWYD